MFVGLNDIGQLSARVIRPWRCCIAAIMLFIRVARVMCLTEFHNTHLISQSNNCLTHHLSNYTYCISHCSSYCSSCQYWVCEVLAATISSSNLHSPLVALSVEQ